MSCLTSPDEMNEYFTETDVVEVIGTLDQND